MSSKFNTANLSQAKLVAESESVLSINMIKPDSYRTPCWMLNYIICTDIGDTLINYKC